jgi:hypothetical protein
MVNSQPCSHAIFLRGKHPSFRGYHIRAAGYGKLRVSQNELTNTIAAPKMLTSPSLCSRGSAAVAGD